MIKTKETIALLERFLKPLSECVIICSRDGIALTFNSATRELFDISSNTRQIQLSNLNGHDLRSSLMRAGLDTADEAEDHCEANMDFEEQITVNGQPRWFQVDSCLLDVPGNTDKLRMIVMRDITAEKRLDAVTGDKEACGFVSEDPERQQDPCSANTEYRPHDPVAQDAALRYRMRPPPPETRPPQPPLPRS